jgi:hypothetical protein
MFYANQILKVEQCVYLVNNLWLPGEGWKFPGDDFYPFSFQKSGPKGGK